MARASSARAHHYYLISYGDRKCEKNNAIIIMSGVFHYEKFISNSIDLIMKYLLQGLYNLPNYTKRSGLLQIQKRIPNTIMRHPMLFTYKTERNLPYLNHCLRLSIRCLEKLTIQGFLLACPHFI